MPPKSISAAQQPWMGPLVLIGATAIALLSALPYAGSWYDGSRLATVECLVDYHTLVIDRSIFVWPNSSHQPPDASPYDPDNRDLMASGTGDKLFIGGHYYSDKSPVLALPMAAVYQLLQWSVGLTARRQPHAFCYLMTLASSGLAYVIAAWCIFQVGGALRIGAGPRLGLTASFALTTVALTYARQVNNHIVLLAVVSALMLAFAREAEDRAWERSSTGRLLALGSMAGFAYTIDLGAGPALLAAALALVTWRSRRLRPVMTFAVAALPWLVLHHALNYLVSGALRPANAFPAYLNWPGYELQNKMTGVIHHSPGHFVVYAAALLFGKRGFVGHNLALFLAIPAWAILLRDRVEELPELLFAGSWCCATWLVYALFSNNYSGNCCTIRWFVPFLAPGYYVLALFLRRYPEYWPDFLALSGWGAVMSAIMWSKGPWTNHLVPMFWPLQAAALLSWLGLRLRSHKQSRAHPGQT